MIGFNIKIKIMIHLNLGIYDGDVQIIKFFTLNELCEYLKELDRFDCIWLATEDAEKGEILITENLETLISSVKNSHFNLLWNSPQNFYVQEYKTYEDAYKVALDMREPNPRCYKKEISYEYNKTKTGFFNHKEIEMVVGDIVDQGGTKNYVILADSQGFKMVNFEHGSTPLYFYISDNDNLFNIQGNIFDNPELIKLAF